MESDRSIDIRNLSLDIRISIFAAKHKQTTTIIGPNRQENYILSRYFGSVLFYQGAANSQYPDPEKVPSLKAAMDEAEARLKELSEIGFISVREAINDLIYEKTRLFGE